MSRTNRRTQKNGRERGNPGNGGGIVDYTPNVVHKGKHETRARQDKRDRQRGWED